MNDTTKMISQSEIEQRRSPSGLLEFVTEVKEFVRADKNKRHLGILKKGLYKEFLDELVPLSRFAAFAYPESFEVQPKLGNQGYDALVFNEVGDEIDRIEITSPHDGAAASTDAKLVVSRGRGQVSGGEPGDDFEMLFRYILDSCQKKAIKDYGDCTLVISIAPMPPFEGFEARYEEQVEAVTREIAKIRFNAKRVFLLLLPDRVIHVHG